MAIVVICGVMWLVGYFVYPPMALLGIAGVFVWVVATQYNNGVEGEKRIIIGVVMTIWGAVMLVMQSVGLRGLFFLLGWLLVGWVVKKIEIRYTPSPPQNPPKKP